MRNSGLKPAFSDLLITTLLTALLLPVYLFSPVSNPADTHYEMLVSHQLLRHGNVDLREYFQDPEAMASYPGFSRMTSQTLPYHVEQDEGGRILYTYPHGSAVLAIPFVAICEAFGLSPVTADGNYDPAAHERMGQILAALLMTTAMLLLYAAGRCYLSPGRVLFLVGSIALGSAVWSTAADAPWTQTWGVFLLSGAFLAVARADKVNRAPSPIFMALLFVAMCFVRPTFFLSGFPIFLMLAYRFPRKLPMLIICCIITGLLLVWFYVHFDLMPVKERHQVGFEFDLTHVIYSAFLHTVSMSRGLIPTTPIVVFCLWLLFHGGRPAFRHPLVLAGLASLGLHIAMLANWTFTGGQCFGSRLTLDVVIWLPMIGCIGWAKALEQQRRIGRADCVAAAALAAAGMFIHSQGALRNETLFWTSWPVDAHKNQERIWSFRYPQWAAGLIHDAPSIRAPFVFDGFAMMSNTSNTYNQMIFGRGWGDIEADFRWSVQDRSYLHFNLRELQDIQLEMTMGAYLDPPRVAQQRVRFYLNGRKAGESVIKDTGLREIYLDLSRNDLARLNTLTLIFPDAAKPPPAGEVIDDRMLGIKLHRTAVHSVTRTR